MTREGTKEAAEAVLRELPSVIGRVCSGGRERPPA
jgi:hypothetical protein